MHSSRLRKNLIIKQMEFLSIVQEILIHDIRRKFVKISSHVSIMKTIFSLFADSD